MFNGTAFCDGVCTETPHTAFHSSVYMLALGAVEPDNVASTWDYIRSRIDPPFSTGMSTGSTGADAAQTDQSAAGEMTAGEVGAGEMGGRGGSWPPPPPMGEKDGMPCGSYVSQFVLQALYIGRYVPN